MTTYDAGLLDTNVLVYAMDQNSPCHTAAKALRDQGLKGEISLCVCPQVLNEFFLR
jgi:predicted nucleic acid-binding protein